MEMFGLWLNERDKPLPRTMKWRTSMSTMKGREAPIALQGSYEIHWKPYATLDNYKNNQFRYLLFKIK